MAEPVDPGDIRALPRVAAISTMASRAESFARAFPTIHAQVSHVFVYLDRYPDVPAFLRGADRVTVRRAEDEGDLHASSRFLCLRDIDRPSLVLSVDDDILYPPDYGDRLAAQLQHTNGRAVVGVHGRIFLPPHGSYIGDARCLHFATLNERPIHVHELGTGTCAFVSSVFDIDPRAWPRNDMDDIMIALEAQRRGLPRVAIARREGWLTAIADNQPDSLWRRTRADDSDQVRHMHALLAMYGEGQGSR